MLNFSCNQSHFALYSTTSNSSNSQQKKKTESIVYHEIGSIFKAAWKVIRYFLFFKSFKKFSHVQLLLLSSFRAIFTIWRKISKISISLAEIGVWVINNWSCDCNGTGNKNGHDIPNIVYQNEISVSSEFHIQS